MAIKSYSLEKKKSEGDSIKLISEDTASKYSKPQKTRIALVEHTRLLGKSLGRRGASLTSKKKV